MIEEGAQQFYIRVGDAANQIFLEIPDLEGLFISGAGEAKDKFYKIDLSEIYEDIKNNNNIPNASTIDKVTIDRIKELYKDGKKHG